MDFDLDLDTKKPTSTQPGPSGLDFDIAPSTGGLSAPAPAFHVSAEPAEFTVKDLKAGYHAYSVLGTDGKGNVRPSGPVLVVVRKPVAAPRP